MFKEFFAGMEFTALPVFGLGLFVAMFVMVVLRTFVFKTKADFTPQSELPLTDGKEIASREVKS
jgi:hypothetical protein